jgi:DNA-binding FadR family transcriptional regulator
MAEHLGVSRTVAREAFRSLAVLGILKVGAGRRARVATPGASPLSMILDQTVHTRQLSIQQVMDVRRTIETRTAHLAALRRSKAEADDLGQIASEMFGRIDEPDALMELDIRFHEVIAQASGNPLYAILVGSFRVITRQTWHIGWRSRATVENRTENIRCHGRIAAAIAEQDAAGARDAMQEHFDSAVSVLLGAGIT